MKYLLELMMFYVLVTSIMKKKFVLLESFGCGQNGNHPC
jgi:hypothetical protein